MDQKTAEFVLRSIEALRKDQKVIIKKVMEFSDAFKISIEKIKKEKTDESETYQTRMNHFETVLNMHTNEIENIQHEKVKIDAWIKVIDDNLDDVDKRIEESTKKIENFEVNDMRNEIKQCIYDRRGYCRKGINCVYFHSEEICIDYVEKSICSRVCCRKRHPHPCRYFLRGNCRRGESCSYLHSQKGLERQLEKCERC